MDSEFIPDTTTPGSVPRWKSVLKACSVKSLARAGASVASGILLAVAFPPVGDSESAWFALVPLLLVTRYTVPRASFGWGVLSGGVFWLMVLSWLLRLSETGGPWPVIGLAWIALSAYCALYTGAFALLASHAWAMHETSRGREATPAGFQGSLVVALVNASVVVAIALIWVGLEYIRSTFCTGFAWNALAVSQYRNLWVIQSAEWGGVYLVSALIVLVNAGLAAVVVRMVTLARRSPVSRWNVELLVALVVLCAAILHGQRAVRMERAGWAGQPSARIAAVQPNILQLKKWPDEFVDEILDRLTQQTQMAARTQPDCILWPETALPEPLTQDTQSAQVTLALATNAGPILVGALDVEKDSGGRIRVFNSSFLVNRAGRIVDQYRKIHLVPFGEYLPLDKVFPWIEKLSPFGYSCWPGSFSTVFRLDPPGVTFSVLICFEDTVADLARRAVKAGAGFLVNQTNDAWFDGSAGAVQHMSHCVFRCIENRVSAVRCANTGVTCFIDSTGGIDSVTQELVDGELRDLQSIQYRTEEVRARAPGQPQTLYTRYGDTWFGRPCGWVTGLAVVWAAWRERKRANGCSR